MAKIRIIIPCCNEQDRLEKTVMQMLGYIGKKGYVADIMMVNDGSTDNTLRVMKRLSKMSNVNFMSYSPNRGKGFAVRFGVLATPSDDYDWVVFSDADGSSHIKYIMPYLSALGNDVIITNRELQGSRISDVSLFRYLSSKIFFLVRLFWLSQRISDSQNGLKAFRMPMAHKLFERSRIDGFAFDVEILHIAKLNDISLAEVPVVWLNTLDSRVRLRHVFAMFAEIVQIRRNSRSGKYKLQDNKAVAYVKV